MSILINGMEIPTRCLACQMNYDSCACILTGSRFYKHNTEFDPGEERLPDCPLVPVPPHGRLIDADALIDAIQKEIDMWKDAGCDMHSYESVIDNYILDAPTIIEAEEETDFYTKGHLHIGYAEEGE